MSTHGVLARYKDLLPVTAQTPIITLGEGGTPLLRSQTLEREIGCGELYFKLEGCNCLGKAILIFAFSQSYITDFIVGT